MGQEEVGWDVGRQRQKTAPQPFQHSCLEHPMDRGVWGATVHGGAESGTTEATQQTGRPLAGSLLET